MILNNKIIFIFNKFFISFIKDVKESSEELKVTIKKDYKIIDKLSTEYIDEFWKGLLEGDLTQNKVLKEFTVKDILEKIQTEEVETLWNHIYTLLAFAYLYNEYKDNTEDNTLDNTEDNILDNILEQENTKISQIETLFNKVVGFITTIQHNSEESNDFKEELDEILDDDLKAILLRITPKLSKNIPSGTENVAPDMGSMFGEMAKNSKIASLAKEISEEIDISSINIEKPEDIMKLMDFSGDNNVMGNIIKKVSSKISDKINSGDLKQDDLLGEAMNMMSMMGGKGGMGGLGDMLNNPMIAELMKSMKKGKPMQTRQDVVSKASARDRLRKKLDERRQKNDE